MGGTKPTGSPYGGSWVGHWLDPISAMVWAPSIFWITGDVEVHKCPLILWFGGIKTTTYEPS